MFETTQSRFILLAVLLGLFASAIGATFGPADATTQLLVVGGGIVAAIVVAYFVTYEMDIWGRQ